MNSWLSCVHTPVEMKCLSVVIWIHYVLMVTGKAELSFSLCLRASLWSSCVVLPLLALTWMSAVLAMTDKRSILFQILFAVFDSLQGFVIVMVHCILRREVGWNRSHPLLLTLSFLHRHSLFSFCAQFYS